VWIYRYFGHRKVVTLLLVVNILGTIYGYYWYKHQLAVTPAIFLPFVPDSPTACLFFVLALVGILIGRNLGLFEALAVISLFKYGIWAVVMNLFTLYEAGHLHWTGYMLMASHFAMAVQGIVYTPYYRIKLWHIAVASIFTLHNEIIDYVFGYMPWYGELSKYMNEIGYFTFWLSILSIGISYFVAKKGNNIQLTVV
jgi:uncharacterized membrane protein YpjA